ncbi:MAG: UDP-glucose 4-epimerase GalE [Vicinamibacterales bacterium]
MNLVVTGGAGYIGSVVAELAEGAGHDVLVVDNLQEGNRQAVPKGCEFVEGHVGDPAVLAKAFGWRPIDAVIHLAAEAAIEFSVTDPGRFFRCNVVEGVALLDAMRQHDVKRMIFSSTAATYGEPHELPIPEDHPQRPINAYGDSKLMFEHILRWYRQAYGLRSISFRYFNAAGATRERGEARKVETHLIPRVLDVALGSRPAMSVYGTDYNTRDGSCVRDYVHVVDIATAHLLALDAIDRLELGFFNIGSETGYTVLEVIKATERVLGRPIATKLEPRRAGDPASLVASAQRVREVLGWKPRYPALDDIIASAWEFRRTHPHGY